MTARRGRVGSPRRGDRSGKNPRASQRHPSEEFSHSPMIPAKSGLDFRPPPPDNRWAWPAPIPISTPAGGRNTKRPFFWRSATGRIPRNACCKASGCISGCGANNCKPLTAGRCACFIPAFGTGPPAPISTGPCSNSARNRPARAMWKLTGSAATGRRTGTRAIRPTPASFCTSFGTARRPNFNRPRPGYPLARFAAGFWPPLALRLFFSAAIRSMTLSSSTGSAVTSFSPFCLRRIRSRSAFS